MRASCCWACLAAVGLIGSPPLAAAADRSPDAGIGYAVVGMMGGVGDLGKLKPGTDLSKLNADLSGKDGQRASLRATVSADGTPGVELSSSADLPQLFLQGGSKVSVSTSGLCPDATGRLAFTIKLSQAPRPGSDGTTAYDRETEVRVEAAVGDNAELAGADMHSRQNERSSAGGRQVYVETAGDWRQTGTGANMEVADRGFRVLRQSSQFTAADQALIDQGQRRAMMLATGALEAAEQHWQSGACLRIDATSPGTVRPRTRSAIPVRVLHKLDGSEVAAKVQARLTGGRSITPEIIARAPGTIVHLAPEKGGSPIEIKLTATSRRGKAELLLKLSVAGDQYSIEGGADEFHGTGTICDLNRPFTVEGSGNVVKFTPSSARGGSYSYSGNMSGFAVWGQGSYTVQYQGDVAVGITASGPGSVKTPAGVVSSNGTEKYTLAPSTGALCP